MPEMYALKSEEQSQQMQLVQREEVEDEEDFSETIDNLITHGINAGDVKKLQDACIYTCNGLLMHTKKSTGIKGLSEAKVDKICEAVEKIVNYGYITGSDALLKRKSAVPTGSQALDELLGGGIETSAITETFGEFRSGKTQLAHTLCVTTQLPTSMQGGKGKAAYIDIEGTFRLDRIMPIAEKFGMDDAAVLDNIKYARSNTFEHQQNLLLGLAAKMAEEPFRPLIVESIIALFGVDFSGREELAKRQSLIGVKGLSEAKVDKICEAVEKMVRNSVVCITTGSQALNELLGGGIETSAITETVGEFRFGKTQLAHTLCVTTQLPTSMQGGKGKAAYIDIEGTFRLDRIMPIAEKFGMDDAAVLDNIKYARSNTFEHQQNLLLGLAAKMAEEPFRPLIVESIIALFGVDFSGREELAKRQILSSLIKIAEEFNVAVYITNQVMSDPAGGVFMTDPKKPAGGHVLAHTSTGRLMFMFREGKDEQCICKVFEALDSLDKNLNSNAPSRVQFLPHQVHLLVVHETQVAITHSDGQASTSSRGQKIQYSGLAESATEVAKILRRGNKRIKMDEEVEVAVSSTLEQQVRHRRPLPIIEVVVRGDERCYSEGTVGFAEVDTNMDWFTLALQIYICSRKPAGDVEVPALHGPEGLRPLSPYNCWPERSVSYLARDGSFLIWPRHLWAQVVASLSAVYIRGAWSN